MRVIVTQSFKRVIEVEIPDEMTNDRQKLRDFWCSDLHSCWPLDSMEDLDWVSINFMEAETGRELDNIQGNSDESNQTAQ